jgi:cytoskeleton protein RodZ
MNSEINNEEVENHDNNIEDVNMEVSSINTIGEALKSAREAKNLSLKVISQHTRISTTILENLENNNFDEIPSKAYVIGFVKIYSKTVNLEESECLRLLNQAYGSKPIKAHHSEASLPTRADDEVQSESSSSSEIPSQYLTIAGVFVALIIVFAIAINSNNQSPTDALTDVEENVEEIVQTPLVNIKPQVLTEKTPLTSAEVEKTVVAAEPETIEVKKVVVETKPTPKEVKKEVKAEKKVEIKEEKKEKLPVEAKKIEVEVEKEIKLKPLTLPLYKVSKNQESAKLIPANFRNSLIAGKQNVFISATDGDTWITYKSDDLAIKKFVLKKGRNLLIRGDLVRVFLGNINVARVYLNNEILSIKSRSGVKSLVFPQEKSSEYKLPLFIYTKSGKVKTSSDLEKKL